MRESLALTALVLLGAAVSCGDQQQPEAEATGGTEGGLSDGSVTGDSGWPTILDGAPACTPQCGARECGNDGCEGSCGACGSYEVCVEEAWCVAPASAEKAPPVRVIALNLCGNNCPYTGVSSTAWAQVIGDGMQAWQTDVGLFTETCYGQLTNLLGRLGAGWGYAWLASHADLAGCGKWGTDRRFGMAIVAKHDAAALPERQTANLMPVPSCEDYNQRQLLCAKPDIDGEATLTCVTHLTHKSGPCRGQQAQIVADLTQSWSSGSATILGGDLNAKPESSELDALYAIGGTGRYLEADQEDPAWWPGGCSGACRSGAPTFPASSPDRKIDFVLFTEAHFESVAGEVLGASAGSATDHRTVLAAAARR